MTVINVDCRVGLAFFPDNHFDSIVTDPPYELGFMGKTWDASGIAHDVAMWREALRVLKPGGYLLAFGGSRTYHRLACAIEDAGFEVRDQIMWLYGSGFPKSHNGEWGGTALKPAHEPIAMARKPLIGTVAANWETWGTGALNIDGCRVEVLDADYARNCSGDRGHAGTRSAEQEGSTNSHSGGGSAAAGRWPANVIHDGSDEVLAAFPDAGGQQGRARTDGAEQANNTFGRLRHVANLPQPRVEAETSAARFFYCAKASRADRNEGCEHLPQSIVSTWGGDDDDLSAGKKSTLPKGNNHPTVKPVALMRYLLRLVTPPGGRALDLFAGSGSTGKAAKLKGFEFVGFELSPEYTAISNARIKAVDAAVI